ncbi:MAG: hypothetical protein A2Z83_09760 [Omnitrophica bacterium GWA2_52_8]|nr:MAG: hypothetical protein A2Z83_09760 [Omnitrophica bacterium GWA2_52_8]
MIEIRRFAPGDESSVRELINGIMSREFRDDLSAYPTEDINDLPKAYGGIGEAFFVALADGKVVGTIGIKKEDGRIALMRRLFVESHYRKKSIGTKLIQRALQFCDEVGYEEVVFRMTSHMNSAAKACQKCGFVQRAKLQLGPIELLKFVLSLSHVRKSA